MVTVSISETYDLHTQVDKMTLIGIHTPKKELIQKTYPGLCMNYKFFRIKSVDVALATSQRLALSWEQVGTDEDKVSPQDSMNPILYKAVSNDSWSTLEARLNGIRLAGSNVVGSMADIENDEVTTIADEHGVYYSLLSNRDGFKIADPQRGLTMKGLRPLVFEKWFNHGVNHGYQNGEEDEGVGIKVNQSATPHALALADIPAQGLRGNAHPMPKINTTYLTWPGTKVVANGMGTGEPQNCQAEMPDVPPVMLGAIIIPPASALSGILYYRMVTRCYIEFTEVRPITEITDFGGMSVNYAPAVYHSDYATLSKDMDTKTDMVDIQNGEIQKIMEGR